MQYTVCCKCTVCMHCTVYRHSLWTCIALCVCTV